MILASNNPFECNPAVPARFIGEFASLVALETAHPTAPEGSYAVVNQSGDDLIYYYSVTDASWFTQAGGGIPEAPEDGDIYGRKDGGWESVFGGTTPTLPQVLLQGDRTIRNADGDGETILEADDIGKLVHNVDGDFLYLPAELFSVNSVLKIHNPFEGVDLFCIPDVGLNPEIYVNGVAVDEFSGIALRAGTAVLKKINGDPFSETWILTYEVLDFSPEALGLGEVDNTSDANKPVSTAQATAISTAQTNAQTYAKNYTDASRLKQPARFAVGTNVTSLSGSITIDSNLVTTDTILLLAQTDQKENGLWVVNSAGAWSRPEDFATGEDVSYVLIHVIAGTYSGKTYVTGAGRIVGTNNIALQDISLVSTTPSWMSQSTPRTLDNTTTLQKIFNVGTSGNGSKSVVSGKRYKCNGWAVFSLLSGSSKTIGVGVLGTATASYVSGLGFGVVNAAAATTSVNQITSFSSNVITAGSANTAGKVKFDFEFICSGSGTIIPSVAFTNAVAGMQVDSAFFEIVEVGESSATSSSDIV
jgi:hypothetical protein